MREIERLEREIKEGLSLIDRIHSAIDDAIEKVDKLKKEDEVKPVFPVNGSRYHGYIVGDRAHRYGLTAYTTDGSEEITRRLEARAYVIEAINRANGGRGKFTVHDDNYYFVFSHARNELSYSNSVDVQELHDDFYINSSGEDEFARLLVDTDFKAAYKTMLGIN